MVPSFLTAVVQRQSFGEPRSFAVVTEKSDGAKDSTSLNLLR
jgi:hypothetical protein